MGTQQKSCAGCGSQTSGKLSPTGKPACDTCLNSIGEKVDVMHKALDLVGAHVINLPAAERSDMASALTSILIAFLRDVEGDDFVRGYLDAALASLDAPKEFIFSLPH